MKHTTINGKWQPANGTFVRVPNEKIPEVIQILRDNGEEVWGGQDKRHLGNHNVVIKAVGGWYSDHSANLPAAMELPDFKALVTGSLPESWCIQCTEESVKHEAYGRMITSLESGYHGLEPKRFYGTSFGFKQWKSIPFGEVLQIETWAAVEEMKNTEPPYMDDPLEILRKGKTHSATLSEVTKVLEVISSLSVSEYLSVCSDDQLITEAKQRGYTISKIY